MVLAWILQSCRVYHIQAQEMEKIAQEDIALMMNEFEELEVDQSGTLQVSDLTLAQSSTTI